MLRIGILGAGKIAEIMAQTIKGMDCVERFAIASRDLQRAEEFSGKNGFRKAYGSYEELVCDPEVELVYVATPHSHHYEHVKLCLEHGKHVLCEKSFTVNAVQAQEILTMAKEKNLLLTEAIWTRYLPMRKTLDDVLSSGVIGTPYMLTANLCYAIDHKERMVNPSLAGGALLDLGVYVLNFASMVFGNDVETVSSAAVLTEQGVDAQNSITLTYRDGKMAVLNSSMMGLSDRRGVIYGNQGFIEVENINNYEEMRVYNTRRKLLASYTAPDQISGYEYEVEACVGAITRGDLECPQMPHDETLRIMRLMDSLREEWGVKYPMEEYR